MVDELDGLDIEFVSRRENIDTTGAMGRLFLTFIGSIAELESDLIKERIKAGMRRRKLEGFKLGRQPLDVNHAALVRDRLAGMSLTDTAKKYGVSRASVVRFVRESQKQFAGVEFQPDSNAACRECACAGSAVSMRILLTEPSASQRQGAPSQKAGEMTIEDGHFIRRSCRFGTHHSLRGVDPGIARTLLAVDRADHGRGLSPRHSPSQWTRIPAISLRSGF